MNLIENISMPLDADYFYTTVRPAEDQFGFSEDPFWIDGDKSPYVIGHRHPNANKPLAKSSGFDIKFVYPYDEEQVIEWCGSADTITLIDVQEAIRKHLMEYGWGAFHQLGDFIIERIEQTDAHTLHISMGS